MRRILLVLLCLTAFSVLRAQDFSFSQRMLDHLLAGRGDSVYVCMSAEVQGQISPAMLNATMAQLPMQAGAYQRQGAWETNSQDGLRVDRCRLVFERMDLQLTLATDAEGRIAGLFFQPVAKEEAAPDAAVDERVVTVYCGQASLPGTLCLPTRREGRVPVVVLVHGSGPNDRDETIGPNKPFRDLAYRLAEAGIATLRYDKRTYVYGARTAEVSGGVLDYDTEAVDDAVAALDLAAMQPAADLTRLYVLGHSLGGLLVPRIAARSHVPLAGMVSLSGGPVRGMEETVREQVAYITRVQGGTEAQADSLCRQLLATMPEPYLRAAAQYDVAAEAQRTHTPFLLLQGGHDYQVTATDFRLWKERLAGRAATDFVWLEGCDHLLRELPRMAVPADYMQPGQMSPAAVEAIVGFVKGGLSAGK